MANTIVGESIVIDGEITGDDDLVVQGTVKGKIALKESLFVESSGTIEADIETRNVEVSGNVTGNVTAADKVELTSDCRM
ncbi:MAG: polymer-forming cytoskeletal protein, partial [Deltaproteobacteria bacterium]|nr:polymer-forming cytoskeletal protein [Deltaproteobacteria bacterium]